MVWEGVLVPEALVQAIAIVGFVVLAITLVIVNAQNRLNRAFATYLILQATSLTLGFLMTFGPDAASVAYFTRVFPYVLVAVVAALAYFLMALRGFPRTEQGRRAVLAGLVALTLLAEVAYLLDHGNMWTFDVGANGGITFTGTGPLLVYGAAITFLQGLALFLCVRDYVSKAAPVPPRSILLVGIGFGLYVVYAVTGAVFQTLRGGIPFPDSMWTDWFRVLYIATLAPIAASIGILAWRFRVSARAERRLLAAAIIAILLPAVTVAIFQMRGTATNYFGPAKPIEFLFNGIWRLALPALGTYALVRHQLFGVELKVRLAVQRTTLAGFFVSAFFVFSEGAQALIANAPLDLPENSRSILGVFGAGLLLLVLSPLRHVADRIAQSATPDAKPVSGMSHAERAELFREQALFAWADGTIDRVERLRLDSLRAKLGLDIAEATRIESQAYWPPKARKVTPEPNIRSAPRAPTAQPKPRPKKT